MNKTKNRVRIGQRVAVPFGARYASGRVSSTYGEGRQFASVTLDDSEDIEIAAAADDLQSPSYAGRLVDEVRPRAS